MNILSPAELLTLAACLAGAIFFAELAVQRRSARKAREEQARRIDAVARRTMPFQK